MTEIEQSTLLRDFGLDKPKPSTTLRTKQDEIAEAERHNYSNLQYLAKERLNIKRTLREHNIEFDNNESLESLRERLQEAKP